jgi:hypothetical protein
MRNATNYVGSLGRYRQPLFGEPYQHFAREGLARSLAGLAPALDEDQRRAALEIAKGALATTGSAEEAAAWATVVKNLLADREDGVAAEEIVEILKYPTVALTAREPNASEPRNATDILAETLQDRLDLKPLELRRPGDLRQVLDLVKGQAPNLDVTRRAERPSIFDLEAFGPS